MTERNINIIPKKLRPVVYSLVALGRFGGGAPPGGGGGGEKKKKKKKNGGGDDGSELLFLSDSLP